MVHTQLNKISSISLNNSKMKNLRMKFRFQINKISFIVTSNHRGMAWSKILINLITEILRIGIFNKFKRIISTLLNFLILQIKINKMDKLCISIWFKTKLIMTDYNKCKMQGIRIIINLINKKEIIHWKIHFLLLLLKKVKKMVSVE